MSIETRHGQTCWVVRSQDVEMAVTENGGHMAPVNFFRQSASPVSPYYVSPWQEEGHKKFPAAVLTSLRGDFFCLPFGGNGAAYQGEKHEPHGETATSRWQLEAVESDPHSTSLVLSLHTQVRPGRVTKKLTLVNGQNVIYSSHRIEGFAGKVPLGHHATLAMPDSVGAMAVFHSPIEFGMTNARVFSDPANKEYQQLAVGAEFESLKKVPSIFRDTPGVDLSGLPARKGYADLVLMVQKMESTPSWVAVLNREAGWMWYSLKDPRQLRSTVIWLENGGRHGFPWNGRNNCVGLEDVTAYFADGLVPSMQDNILNQKGIPTTVELRPDIPTEIRYIQGVVKVDADFDSVKTVGFHEDESLSFISQAGRTISTPVQWRFVLSR